MPLETPVRVRAATPDDAPAIARLRLADAAATPDQDAFEADRARRYLLGEHHPREALAERTAFVAVHDGRVVGVAAGHRTTRHGCQGELQWLTVAADYRERGLATGLLRPLAKWFVAQGARRVCVDADDAARPFYERRGAVPLDGPFLVWEDVATLEGPR